MTRKTCGLELASTITLVLQANRLTKCASHPYGKTGLVTSPQLVRIYCLIDLKVLARWAQAIVNHLYWSIFTCGGNGKELIERFTSFQHHIVNKHKFPNNIYYKRCEHEALSEGDARRRQWLEMGSESHEKLRKILCEKTFLVDLENMTEQVNTAMLQVFHALKIAYLPKKTFFGIEKMIAATQIAALDHNHIVNREQVQTTNIFFAPEFLLSVST